MKQKLIQKIVAGYVYLLGFIDQQGNRTRYKHAQYYAGSTIHLTDRIETHRQGRGNGLLRAAREAGLSIVLVAVQSFPNEDAARAAESRYKRWHCNHRVYEAIKRDREFGVVMCG